jgi:hypothetical protein
MNPEESPNTFKFLETVYESEKRALEERYALISQSVPKSKEEDKKKKMDMAELERRLRCIAKETANHHLHPLIRKDSEGFSVICPRCLVHTGSPVKMSDYGGIGPIFGDSSYEEKPQNYLSKIHSPSTFTRIHRGSVFGL